MNAWSNIRKILCVRPDNMGDVLMSSPAIRALKQTFNARISLLTSPMGKEIAACLPPVDDILVWEAPWVKGTSLSTPEAFTNMVDIVRQEAFDAAVLFTVFSQNPLPAALMATMAGIPLRLAYCRENPYHLLSHWVPEREPYHLLRHQVRRDLDLVKVVGATTADEDIRLNLPLNAEATLRNKMKAAGVDLARPWLVMHPGVSETKREYPPEYWVHTGKRIAGEYAFQLIITGAAKEKPMITMICDRIGKQAFSLAGMLNLKELMMLIRLTPLLISVNTGTVHIASAFKTKMIVLYALTNPQHPPWKATGRVLPFSVTEALQSKNEVLRFVQDRYYSGQRLSATPDDILTALHELIVEHQEPAMEELVLPPASRLQGMRNTLNFHDP